MTSFLACCQKFFVTCQRHVLQRCRFHNFLGKVIEYNECGDKEWMRVVGIDIEHGNDDSQHQSVTLWRL